MTDQQPTAFVWIYWSGGAQGDELRLSIESVRRFFQGPVSIHVVGDKPDWYDGHHVPVDRVPEEEFQRARDTLEKMRVACACDEIPHDFFWMTDDMYLIRPVDGETLSKPRRAGRVTVESLGDYPQSNEWERLKLATFEALTARGRPLIESAIHAPFWVDSTLWLAVWSAYGLMFRTMVWHIIYAAEWWASAEEVADFRKHLDRPHTREQLDALTHTVLHNSEAGWNDDLREFLTDRISGEISLPPLADPDADRYWRLRKRHLYYQVAKQYAEWYAPAAGTLLEVGGGVGLGCRYLEWFPDHDRTVVELPSNGCSLPGVRVVHEDFSEWEPDQSYGLVLCLQVLEHVVDPQAFAQKLLQCGRVVVASVPYLWDAARNPEHIHDPISKEAFYSWFGMEPHAMAITSEGGVRRLVAVFIRTTTNGE